MTDAPRPADEEPWPRVIVSAAIAFSGLWAIVYTAHLSLVPFADVAVPIAWQALGAIEVIAGVGVYRGRTWGRWLSVVVIIVTMLLSGARAALAIGPEPTADLAASLASIVIDVILLWWLLRHWTSVPPERP